MPQHAKAIVTITNRLGLHARPAMSLVDLASGFSASVIIRRTDDAGAEAVDGKSIMQVMMLAATQGTELEITCEGDDAQALCDGLASLVGRGFDED
ncbi:MAG: HPr family phosphocarrier protein [Planctomycetota bacterium]